MTFCFGLTLPKKNLFNSCLLPSSWFQFLILWCLDVVGQPCWLGCLCLPGPADSWRAKDSTCEHADRCHLCAPSHFLPGTYQTRVSPALNQAADTWRPPLQPTALQNYSSYSILSVFKPVSPAPRIPSLRKHSKGSEPYFLSGSFCLPCPTLVLSKWPCRVWLASYFWEMLSDKLYLKCSCLCVCHLTTPE